MKLIKKIIAIIFKLIVFTVLAMAILYVHINYKNNHYYKYVNAVGEYEKIYTKLGENKVAYKKYKADNICREYVVWYPKNMEETTYPLVVMVNGTGVTADRYKAVFKHLASHGFIVVGNMDEDTRSGLSSDLSLAFMLKENDDKESIFYNKINTCSIGIAGHSQGGVGAVNAVTRQSNGGLYKAIFTASITSPAFANENVLGEDWCYSLEEIKIPMFMVAGTGAFDSGSAESSKETKGQGIAPLWALKDAKKTLNKAPAIVARRNNTDHGESLINSDGYMTCWFKYYLQGDSSLERVFFGDKSEIENNSNWSLVD